MYKRTAIDLILNASEALRTGRFAVAGLLRGAATRLER